jgi:hypothetical protein
MYAAASAALRVAVGLSNTRACVGARRSTIHKLTRPPFPSNPV